MIFIMEWAVSRYPSYDPIGKPQPSNENEEIANNNWSPTRQFRSSNVEIFGGTISSIVRQFRSLILPLTGSHLLFISGPHL